MNSEESLSEPVDQPTFEDFGGKQDEWPELFPPPREVPRALTWYLQIAGTVWGAALFFVSSLLWMPVIMQTGWIDDARIDDYPVTAIGVLTRLDQTPIFGGRRPIMCHRYAYRFTLPDGRQLQGVSYDYRRVGMEKRRPPFEVVIEFAASHPESNRVEGTHAGLFELWPIVRVPAFLVGLVGIGLMLRGIRAGRKAIRLLSHGEVAPNDQITKLRDMHGVPLLHRDLGAMQPILFDPSLPGLGLAVHRIEGLRLTREGEWRADYRVRLVLVSLLLAALLLGGPILVGVYMIYTG